VISRFLFLASLSCVWLPSSVWAQEWLPKRIVGMGYPPLGAQARIQGSLNLRCVIDKDGRVESARIESASNSAPAMHGILGEAAKINVMQWRFTKNDKDSASASSVTIVRYFFILLDGGCSDGRLAQEFAFEYPNSVFVTSETPCLQGKVE